MNVVDLLVTIIVVTILVTIALGVVTYIAYKLRLARRPSGGGAEEESPRYFDLHVPPAAAPGIASGPGAGAPGTGGSGTGPRPRPVPAAEEREFE